jgi:hypothetical protein
VSIRERYIVRLLRSFFVLLILKQFPRQPHIVAAQRNPTGPVAAILDSKLAVAYHHVGIDSRTDQELSLKQFQVM